LKFEVLEHASDVGLKFFGHDFETLVRNALLGTAFLIGDVPEDSVPVERTVTMEFESMADFLIQLLSKEIYFFDTELIIFDHVDSIPSEFPGSSNLKLSGHLVKSEFKYRYVLKSPTYYDFTLSVSEGYGTVIFDI